MNRKGFEFSFGWIFAIIVGAVIIFLGIYAATKMIGAERKVTDTEVAKQIDILLNPLSTGLEEGKTAIIQFSSETRIYNDCTLNGVFGEQKISAATKSSIGGEAWTNQGFSSKSLNKYVFSDKIVEGKNLVVFSKPFSMPYKVGDLIFIWGDKEKFCFVNAPREIKEEIMNLKPKNIEINDSKVKCGRNSTKVCFAESGCDVDVSLAQNKVSKNGKTLYYEGNLIYGAIFGDADLYECQVMRLMKRDAELAKIYKLKSESLTPKGCSSNLEGQLSAFGKKAFEMKGSGELNGLSLMAEEIRKKNDDLVCELF